MTSRLPKREVVGLGTWFLVYQGYDRTAATPEAALERGLQKIPLSAARTDEAAAEARRIWQEERRKHYSIGTERFPRHPKLVWALDLEKSRDAKTAPTALKENQYLVTVDYGKKMSDLKRDFSGGLSGHYYSNFGELNRFSWRHLRTRSMVMEAVLAEDSALNLHQAKALLRGRGLRPATLPEFAAFLHAQGERYEGEFLATPVSFDRSYPWSPMIHPDDGPKRLSGWYTATAFFPTETYFLGVPIARR